MAPPRAPLGDSHNFGRRVEERGDRIAKPRTIVWEQLALSAESPLRRALDEAAKHEGVPEAFAFLPDLAFLPPEGDPRHAARGGEVTRIALEPLGDLSDDDRATLARVVGRSLALWSFLGVADLHWENLALGRDPRGHVVLAPLDVEMILDDLSRPTETKLLPDADPELGLEGGAVVRHAAGARRALPFLGKPVPAAGVVTIAGAYLATLDLLERHARAIADAFAGLPALREVPIRVCLRGTDEYVNAASRPPWPPLLDAEREQMDRGDIPYFFRLYGRAGIHYYADAALERVSTLPLEGDVPRLPPLLSIARALRSPSRAKLRDEGLFTVLGAFDHASLAGDHRAEGLAVTFRPRSIVATLASGEELRVGRDLSAFVGSVYSSCRCGEVATPLVPKVTVCEAATKSPPSRAASGAVRAREKRGSRRA
jgi:hypothetical protein